MAKACLSGFLSDRRGAVAATYAIALPALIMVGGVAFDYSRMVSMDSELQTAADNAALVGVTQLDGRDGARAAAIAAAQSWVNNWSLMSQSVGKITLTAANVTFYASADDSTPVTTDAAAKVMEVTIDPRAVVYVLTPIMDAFGPTLTASARAGYGSAICKVPPLFMCNPAEINPGDDFPVSELIGAGIKLTAGSPTVPGNFGFLDTLGTDNSTGTLAKALGWTDIPADCSPTGNAGLKPGQRDVVFGAYNTRFDITENGAQTCPSGGSCPAARNVRKDLVKGNNGNVCSTSGNNGWGLPTNWYQPTSASPLTSNYPDTMGHPRDMCHSVSFDGTCTYKAQSASPIGNKAWDRDAYFRVNFGYTNAAAWQDATKLSANATRSEVYDWELKDESVRLASKNLTGGKRSHSTPVCRTAAATTDRDRRRASMAIVNCKDQAGKIAGNDTVKVLKYVDVFYVEPAFNRGSGSTKRTTDDQIYVEVVGETKMGDGKTAQVVRRDVPYLIR